jgi:uncharacterized membrane protein YebE (DUF533 family)
VKTDELIQLGALAAIGFLAYQKFKKPEVKSPPAPNLQPYIPPTDFGLSEKNATDTTWGDAVSPAYLLNMINWAF